ncbi:FUN14 domain-containing protein [Seminavis robusta]|uniref:FUN14 domain-containing protein n=1 Tax=Seminavis robusta TaxID=568900 RepID=A0A9N8HS08_9STRA|nr:FUN14 domain-containing protein [Seminavis robusta]|eukprot:Sro1124_g243780.1 FUN14 domain-containing protein (151) ;mRNA; f:11034-11585
MLLTAKVRGGGFFGGGKASPSPSSNFVDSMVSGMGEKFQETLETGVPTQITYGFIAGYCSGMAMKRVGQAAATVLGIGFVTLQTLNYYGYIEISHDKFKSTVENALDLNKDGKVDKSDIQRSFDKLMGVLSYNVPSGGGFVAGFLGGVRS